MNLSPSQITAISANPLTNVGQMGFYNGKTYRYVKAGGANIARGKLNVQATIVANHMNMSWAVAPTAGDKMVKVTLGATAATADFYKGGELVVQDGTGEGRSYFVEGNLAADSAGTCTVYLREAIDTTGALAEANVDLIANKYSGVVISVTDQADNPVGVCPVALTAAYYGWMQTSGACAVLQDEACAIGSALTIGSSVAGAVEAVDAAAEPLVGYQGPQTGVDTEYTLVYLDMDNGFGA